jgi:hypothetical protein
LETNKKALSDKRLFIFHDFALKMRINLRARPPLKDHQVHIGLKTTGKMNCTIEQSNRLSRKDGKANLIVLL